MLEGITAGFILSLTLFPGTVWLAKVGLYGSRSQVFSVGIGFACSQWLWLLVSAPGLMMMTQHLQVVRGGMHLFAAFVLVYMAWKFFRTPRVTDLGIQESIQGNRQLGRHAFTRALAMPMRLPTAMAVLLATGVYVNNPPGWATVPKVLVGATIGVLWWWGQFSLLSAFFAKRVSEGITIRSLNKIRPFCAVLCIFLAGISVLLSY